MTRCGKAVTSMLLWTWGGTLYFFCEVIYKTARGRPESISWTMLLVAILLCVPLERCGAELPWEMPLGLQAIVCAVAITATADLECVAGAGGVGLLPSAFQPLGPDLPALFLSLGGSQPGRHCGI